MKKLFMLFCVLAAMIVPVSAMDFTAPTVPDAGDAIMPETYDSFWDGVWYIIRNAVGTLQPSFRTACGVCLSLIAVTILTSLIDGITDKKSQPTRLVAAIMIACLLLQQANSFFEMSKDNKKLAFLRNADFDFFVRLNKKFKFEKVI